MRLSPGCLPFCSVVMSMMSWSSELLLSCTSAQPARSTRLDGLLTSCDRLLQKCKA